ncbi:hypothetical protein ACXLRA_001713 [Vibrio vulnificus]|uniref:hypothetical protein n=1 Tax=Vibrio vulnificus TaxID=672 RepID=UPI0012FAABCD|nr:hypothetical protein [Vibrio vulnificus]MVT22040.1 hypothetical protein [Vibrio vulnificus]HAS6281466.1 hypothetical protein [Vibrio vulnificus]HDY7589856.1 hypothetical protein [Vibrio vulnificus]HDY8141470.1 hypothetical protein [Vibrio vulnificus]HDY8220421.1 hypothetical protein [Vibrio vulnificus]
MRKILYLDVCGTLFDSNTTFDFLEFYFKGHKKYLVLFMRKFFICKILNKMFLNIFQIDMIRMIAVYLLRGESKLDLKVNAKVFISGLKKNQSIFDYIEDNYSNVDDIYLLSASLDFIVEEVCLFFNYSGYFSTTLFYDSNEICLGSISNDLLLSKSSIIKEHGDNSYKIFISDNFSDVIAAKYVNEFVPVVSKKHRNALEFWSEKGYSNAIEY